MIRVVSPFVSGSAKPFPAFGDAESRRLGSHSTETGSILGWFWSRPATNSHQRPRSTQTECWVGSSIPSVSTSHTEWFWLDRFFPRTEQDEPPTGRFLRAGRSPHQGIGALHPAGAANERFVSSQTKSFPEIQAATSRRLVRSLRRPVRSPKSLRTGSC